MLIRLLSENGWDAMYVRQKLLSSVGSVLALAKSLHFADQAQGKRVGMKFTAWGSTMSQVAKVLQNHHKNVRWDWPLWFYSEQKLCQTKFEVIISVSEHGFDPEKSKIMQIWLDQRISWPQKLFWSKCQPNQRKKFGLNLT